MAMNGHDPDSPLTTLTHARLRALQGDVSAARRILTAILDQSPEDGEARALLAELAGRGSRPGAAEVDEPAEPAPERGDPREMAARFRRVMMGRHAAPARVVRHLERWLETVQRNAGASGVRG
jgi:hypothetical protein